MRKCVSAILLLVPLGYFGGAPLIAQQRLADVTASQNSGPNSSGAPRVDDSYVIGADDIVRVSVFEDNRFGGSLRVLPDGRISLPYGGEVAAAGLTRPQLQDAVNHALLLCCLKDPHAAVQIEAVRSKKIYFEGDGISAGFIEVPVPLKLVEAIATKGGLRDFADKRHVTIMRGGKVFKVVNYKDLLKGKNPELNVVLLAGDYIIVN
jgi:polysaccharide biosynthesis/export protein